MKKVLILLFACMLLCSCGAERTPPPSESGTTAATVHNESTSAPSETVSESTPQPTGESTAPLQSEELITVIAAERAQEIAFEKAGVTRAEVTRLECELDYDDDRKRREYDIEFNVGTTEYNCEVDAESGEIVKFYTDRD